MGRIPDLRLSQCRTEYQCGTRLGRSVNRTTTQPVELGLFVLTDSPFISTILQIVSMCVHPGIMNPTILAQALVAFRWGKKTKAERAVIMAKVRAGKKAKRKALEKAEK